MALHAKVDTRVNDANLIYLTGKYVSGAVYCIESAL